MIPAGFSYEGKVYKAHLKPVSGRGDKTKANYFTAKNIYLSREGCYKILPKRLRHCCSGMALNGQKAANKSSQVTLKVSAL
jgi:hypothetical protein